MTNNTYTTLEALQVLKDGEDYITGEEWLTRAQALTKGTTDDKVYEFYAKKENWHLLPQDVDYLYFADTEFRRSGGGRCVGCLYRSGAGWGRGDGWLDRRFDRGCRVGRLASSSESSASKPSSDPLISALTKRVEALEAKFEKLKNLL